MGSRALRHPFLLLLFLFALAGCVSTGTIHPDPSLSPSTEKEALRWERGELRPLAYGGEIGSNRYPVEEGRLSLVANGFSLDLYFNDSIDLSLAAAAIQIKGTDAPFTVQTYGSSTGLEHVINLTMPQIDPGDYQVVIAATLQGINSSPMAENVTIQLHLEHQTEGEFFLLDSSGLPRPISYEECRIGLSLSDSAKTFIVHFDQEVNQVSIEDSLRAGLSSQPANTTFTWLTPQQLRISLNQLQTGISYQLKLEQGLDKKGNGILGTCIFRTGKASNVGVIQLSSREMSMLYQFSEERFSGVRSGSINNRVLLQAGTSRTWSFGLGTRQLFTLPTQRYDLAIPQHYREPIWLDFDHLLAYDSATKTLNRVSVPEGSATPIYTLEDRPLECRLSPNGRMLAVVCRNKTETQRADLFLIDMDNQRLLHQAPSFALTHLTTEGLTCVNLTWTGDDTLIYADDGDILRAYISPEGKIMEKTNVLQKNAEILDYLAKASLLLYFSPDDQDSLYLLQDDKNRRLKNITAAAKDFYGVLVDEETILYQQEGDIYLYAIDQQENELIGSGLLLGVSANRDKAYYMVNAEDYTRSLGP